MFRHEKQNQMAKQRHDFLTAQKNFLYKKTEGRRMTLAEENTISMINQQLRSLRVNFQF